MLKTKEQLTNYLKEKYNPIAIVLHGSRANGMAREHSDWDILMFIKEDIEVISREIQFGINFELKKIVLPVPEDKFLGFFFRTENAEILFDTDNFAKKLLKQNDAIISKGNQFEDIDKTKRRAFLLSGLDGIEDYADEPMILIVKKVDFYTKAIESWFRFIKREYQPSYYYALPRIQKDDPEFYDLLKQFIDENNSKNLVTLGNKITEKLFPNLDK